MIGGRTVLSEYDVDNVAESGGSFVVSPNFNKKVVKKTKQKGMVSLPGVATPTEAFAALENGADELKIFPAKLTPSKRGEGTACRTSQRYRPDAVWWHRSYQHGRLPRSRCLWIRVRRFPVQARV